MENSNHTKQQYYKQYSLLPFNFDNFSLDNDLLAPNFIHFKDNCKCSICLNFYFEPRMCGKCQTLYCKRCIYKWTTEKNGKCPIHGSEYIDSDISIPVRNLLSVIQFKCPSLNSSCGYINYDSIRPHIEKCQYVKRDFKCHLCGIIKHNESEIISHIAKCPESIINCKYCNKPIKRKSIELHRQSCLVVCQDCKLEVLQLNMKKHTLHECNRRVIDSYKTEQKKLVYEVNHYKNQCKLYEDEIDRLKGKVAELELVIEESNRKELSIANRREKKIDKIDFISSFTEHEDQVSCIVKVKWTRDEDTFITGGWDSYIKVWKIGQSDSINTLNGHEDWVTCMCYIEWDTDDTTLVSGGVDSSLKVWNIETGECMKNLIGHDDWISSIEQLKSFRNHIITGSHDRMIKLWDIQNGCCLKTIAQEQKITTMNLLTQNGLEYIIFSLGDFSLKLMALNESNKVVRSYTGHNDEITCFVSLGDEFATGSKDKSIKIWSLEKTKPIKPLVGHNHDILGLLKVDIVENETHILSCSQDRNIKIWNTENGFCISTFNEHYLAINSLVLFKNNNFSDIYIISGGDDNIVSFWKF
jgi:WD40 repeat protein